MPERTLRSRMPASWPAAVFSLALAFCIVAGGTIVSNGVMREVGFAGTHIGVLRALDLVWIALLAVCVYAVVVLVPGLYGRLRDLRLKTFVPETGGRAGGLHAALAGLFGLVWLPTLLTYAPGGVNPDAMFSIKQALFGGTSLSWDNRHPVAYSLFLRIWLGIGQLFHSMMFGVLLATLVQYVLVAVVCSYCVVWLARKGVPVAFVVTAALFFGLFPAFWYYAVGLSQDTVFAVLILLYSMHLADVVESDGALLATLPGGVTFAVLSTLVCFSRNNGFLVVACVGVALMLLYRLRIMQVYALLAGVAFLVLLIQGPGYGAFHVKKPLSEALGMPLQQMAYVVATRGDVPAADAQVLNHILPIANWGADYAPASVDPVKGDPAFDSQYLERHLPQAAATWFHLLLRNPGSYADAYALSTFGYWKPFLGTWPAIPTQSIVNNKLGIHRVDVVARLTGHSLAPLFDGLNRSVLWHLLLNAGLSVWLAALSATVLVSLGKARWTLALVPCLGSWLGLMLAAPLAFHVRYLLMFVFCLPLILLLPLIAMRRDAGEHVPVPEVTA